MRFRYGGAVMANDPSSATRRTGGFDCNRDPPAGFAAALKVGPSDRSGHRFAPVSSTFTAIQSPRKPNGLSHCIFECLIVEASSQAQNHLSVLADRHPN